MGKGFSFHNGLDLLRQSRYQWNNNQAKHTPKNSISLSVDEYNNTTQVKTGMWLERGRGSMCGESVCTIFINPAHNLFCVILLLLLVVLLLLLLFCSFIFLYNVHVLWKSSCLCISTCLHWELKKQRRRIRMRGMTYRSVTGINGLLSWRMIMLPVTKWVIITLFPYFRAKPGWVKFNEGLWDPVLM